MHLKTHLFGDEAPVVGVCCGEVGDRALLDELLRPALPHENENDKARGAENKRFESAQGTTRQHVAYFGVIDGTALVLRAGECGLYLPTTTDGPATPGSKPSHSGTTLSMNLNTVSRMSDRRVQKLARELTRDVELTKAPAMLSVSL